ncbi:4Fe-4S dicluster domain-containing protein [Inmirania thermothiophila]|uniref:4Fe-4S dicluster protein n=1 Tax=Inmirania thermothiophila TaxID=1750597 RepID=A0A3N1Y2L2_9GAMM|nr:4Fe-4S dicluster domain-containing protein [Inmirania thermothiophila]ROR32758.1 4Fe-4S dicluster protein [Inmirania thermothiophila]
MRDTLHHLSREGLAALFARLREAGYAVHGPRVEQGAVVLGPLASVEDLPRGVVDHQEPGRYRLERTGSARLFDHAAPAQGLRRYTFAPREVLWRSRPEGAGWRFEPAPPEAEPVAVLGVRACDLAALALQDRHFLGGPRPDPHYRARREALFLVGVDCARPAETCFCAATGDGPAVEAGADLRLTELESGFLVAAGSARGEALLARLPVRPATPAEEAERRRQIEAARRAQRRGLPEGVAALLTERLEHSRYEFTGLRCLACGNCTLVCPTCFCHGEREEPQLDGTSLRVREWDGCFAEGHGYIAGCQLRPRPRERYRQWIVHKLGNWQLQYGRSGCVGCGRCITWCPAGIDLTREAAAIAEGEF